jgi:hypothetical protein
MVRMATSRFSTEQLTHIAQDGYALVVQINHKNAGSEEQKTGGRRARCTPPVALQQRCSLPMTARSRACDAAPGGPKSRFAL